MVLARLLTIAILISFLGCQAAPAQTGKDVCKDRKVPHLTDIYSKTGIKFLHTSAPEKKYIVESMSGGVLLIDYDRDGLLDIYFTNSFRCTHHICWIYRFVG